MKKIALIFSLILTIFSFAYAQNVDINEIDNGLDIYLTDIDEYIGITESDALVSANLFYRKSFLKLFIVSDLSGIYGNRC